MEGGKRWRDGRDEGVGRAEGVQGVEGFFGRSMLNGVGVWMSAIESVKH